MLTERCPLCHGIIVDNDIITDPIILKSLKTCCECYIQILMASDKLTHEEKLRVLKELGIKYEEKVYQ